MKLYDVLNSVLYLLTIKWLCNFTYFDIMTFITKWRLYYIVFPLNAFILSMENNSCFIYSALMIKAEEGRKLQ